jgi:arylsulfatase A-like enzyme
MTDHPPAGPGPTLPALLRRVAAHAVLGLVAGGAIFLLEAGDRLSVLRDNLDGAGELAWLGLLLAATALPVGLFGLAAGFVLTTADAIRLRIAARLGLLPERWRGLVGLLAAAAVAAGALRALSGLFPTVVQGPFVRHLLRFDQRLVPLGPLAEYPRVTYTVALALVVLAMMALQAYLFGPRGPKARIVALAVGSVLGVAAVGGYVADSRVEFTRYEYVFHIPVEIGYSALALVALVSFARAFGDPTRVALSRGVLVVAGLFLALAVSSVAAGAVAMDASQNVKALFWNRSVIARRVFQLGRILTDGDGDGFSSRFGGGDAADANPRVNPLAAEVQGNGVDDNCVAGDLAAGEAPQGAVFARRGPEYEGPQAEPARAAGRDVIILSIDCVRADRLGCYGYSKPISPNIDRLAAESLLFENAYAAGTNTGHSFSAMFRSGYGVDIVDDRIPGFAGVLNERGYASTLINAVSSYSWLEGARWSKYKQIAEDVVDYHTNAESLWDARRLTDEAIAFFDAADPATPRFTWIHYYDVHHTRNFHPEHDYGRDNEGRYDGNIAYVDEHLGRLVEHLRKTGVLERAIVFVIADHGEAFLEHGAQDHNNKPYQNNTHVPLIVRAPGVAPGRVREPVSLIDVGPTALGFVGIDVPSSYRGIDLVRAARAGAVPRRDIISETPRNLLQSPFFAFALVRWPHKVIYDVESYTLEVFDLEKDPGEQHNLADRDPELAARMREAIGSWLDRETSRTGPILPGGEGQSDER